MSNKIEDYTDEELVSHYRDMQHLSVDTSTKEGLDNLRYYQRLIRQIARRFASLIENMEVEKVTHKNGWILLSEQLPEVGKNVLVCDDDGDIYFSHRVNINQDKWAFYDEWGDKIKSLIAWCHLPEPYQAESEAADAKKEQENSEK